MTVSYAEHRTVTCKDCQTVFSSELWLLVDAQEQAALVAAVYEGRLHAARCPQCGCVTRVRAPLLYHDSLARCVLFVAPTGVEEYQWQEQARTLYTRLLENLAPEQHAPYLNDVQIVQDMAGVNRVLQRRTQRQVRVAEREAPPAEDGPQVTGVKEQPTPREGLAATINPQLWAAINALLGADSFDELHAMLSHHPSLQSAESLVLLKRLANDAFEQREYALAESLLSISQVIQAARLGKQPAQGADPLLSSLDGDLHPDVYHALIQAQTLGDLEQATRLHPVLLEPWIEEVLDNLVDEVLAEGYERLAHILVHRRELLKNLLQERESETELC